MFVAASGASRVSHVVDLDLSDQICRCNHLVLSFDMGNISASNLS